MPVFRLGDLEDRRTRQVQRLKNIGPKLQFSHKSNTTGLFYSNAATWWRDKHSYGNTHPAPHSHVVRKKKQKELAWLAYVNTRKYIENTSYRYI